MSKTAAKKKKKANRLMTEKEMDSAFSKFLDEMRRADAEITKQNRSYAEAFPFAAKKNR
jgi:hypothetical protein